MQPQSGTENSNVTTSSSDFAVEHKRLDTLVLERLRRYGVDNAFNAVLTLVAVVKTCDKLSQSLADVDEAIHLLERNVWLPGIVEAAFHLKSYKIVRDLPLLHLIADEAIFTIQPLEEEPNIKPNIAEATTSLAAVPGHIGEGVLAKTRDERCDSCRLWKFDHCEIGPLRDKCKHCTACSHVCSWATRGLSSDSSDAGRKVSQDLHQDLRYLFECHLDGELVAHGKDSDRTEKTSAAIRSVLDVVKRLYHTQDDQLKSDVEKLLETDFACGFTFRGIHIFSA